MSAWGSFTRWVAEVDRVLEVVHVEAPERVSQHCDEALLGQPHHVGLAGIKDLGRAEAERGEAAHLAQSARIVKEECLGKVAEEREGAGGVHLRGVAAGQPFEEVDLLLPAVGVGVAAEAGDAA